MAKVKRPSNWDEKLNDFAQPKPFKPNKTQQKFLDNLDHIVISSSGGKDSAILIRETLKRFPHMKDYMTIIHAVIDIDWHETRDMVKKQAKHFGLPLVEVWGQYGPEKGKLLYGDNWADDPDSFEHRKTILYNLILPRRNMKTGKLGQQMWPEMGNSRWCTAEMKIAPINKWINNNFEEGSNILQVIGERFDESAKRFAMAKSNNIFRKNDKTSKKLNVFDWSLIHHISLDEVWTILEKEQIPTHKCYSWGVSRASCAICIYSDFNEILICADKAPDIAARMIYFERALDHTFRRIKNENWTIQDILEFLADHEIDAIARKASKALEKVIGIVDTLEYELGTAKKESQRLARLAKSRS